MCSDVNECDLNTNNCHWNATCHNNVGSYTCSCNEDTFGDGFVCTDVNGTDSHNGNNPLVFGDPHFVFNSVDNERICFNYDGDLEHPMLLVADPVSGLYITGILQRAGKAKAFREIQILTPNGISASVTKSHITVIKGGKILLTKDSNELHAKEELYEDDLYISRHPRTRDWDIRIGGDIHLHVINKHHLTLSYTKLDGLSDRTKGVVGFFAQKEYKVVNRHGNSGQLYIRNTFVDVEWSQLARFPCWKIHQDTVSEFLGTSNLMLHGFLQ